MTANYSIGHALAPCRTPSSSISVLRGGPTAPCSELIDIVQLYLYKPIKWAGSCDVTTSKVTRSTVVATQLNKYLCTALYRLLLPIAGSNESYTAAVLVMIKIVIYMRCTSQWDPALCSVVLYGMSLSSI